MTFKFIHAADIHLDSPLRGLEAYAGAPVEEIRDAARKALQNLVDLAIAEKVAFVIIAGDLYDGSWRHINTGLFFVAQASRLKEAGIPLLLIAGNHDAANKMTKTLNLPENVVFFGSKSPETHVLDQHNVAIHGQSFATAAVLNDLSVQYPAPVPGRFNIGVLHTCAAGREGHERYAPCSVEGLCLKGYDYWALGHIHLRETLSERPYIAFSGNIQGRHIRECGPKGVLLVTVADDRIDHVEFRAIDVLRWEIAHVDVTGIQVVDQLLDRVDAVLCDLLDAREGRTLAVRVILEGTTELHDTLQAQRAHIVDEVRSKGLQLSSENLWIEKVKLNTQAPQQVRQGESISDDAIAELNSIFDAMQPSSDLLEKHAEDVLKKLPSGLKENQAQWDREWMAEVIAEAKARLVHDLKKQEVKS